MKQFNKFSIAIVSLFSSGTLLAQSAPPKPAPQGRDTAVAQAQTPALGAASSGASTGGETATGMSTGAKVAIGVGVAAIIGAAASSGGGSSTTTHH